MTTLTKEQVKEEQQRLRELGFYGGNIDGLWGDGSKKALEEYEKHLVIASKLSIPITVPQDKHLLAWGKKVSQVFKDRVIWMANDLLMPSQGADWLMSCMAWENNETFSSSIKNMAGSGATGLIQFMPSTAKSLGTTVEKLALMTAEDQLNYVYKYFAPYKGKLNSIDDVYMAILWPLGIGKPLTYVLWSKDTKPTTYRQNSGLDINKDGLITKAEASRKVKDKLAKGLTDSLRG